MCPEQSTNIHFNIDYNLNSINADIIEQLLQVQKVIKKSQISTWCDHIPEWQMFFTNLLQYLFASNNLWTTSNNIHYLEESLQHYEKIKNYFNHNEIEEELFILFELIKQEIKSKEELDLQYNENNEPVYPCVYTSNSHQSLKFYDKNMKITPQMNSILFKYKLNMQTINLNKKFKFSNILELGIINRLFNNFSFKNNKGG